MARRYSLDNENGSSIAMVLVIAAVLIMMGWGLLQVVMGHHYAELGYANIEETKTLKSQIDVMSRNRAHCTDSLRITQTQRLPFNPGNPAAEANVNYLYIGNRPIAVTNGQPIPSNYESFQSGLSIESMKIIKGVSAPLSVVLNVGGVDRNFSQYDVNLQVVTEKNQSALGSRESLINVPLTVYSNSSGEIEFCELNGSKLFQVAAASRSGLAIAGHVCREPVPSQYYDSNGCTSTSPTPDGICDGDTNLWKKRAVAEHPLLSTAEWGESFPQRSGAAGPNPLAPQEEGRCLVDIVSPPDLDPVQDVFLLYNEDPPGAYDKYEGIGCNKLNGWYLSSCTLSKEPNSRDSDVSIKVDASGEYCVTNAYQRPHDVLLGYAWITHKAGVTVICTKKNF